MASPTEMGKTKEVSNDRKIERIVVWIVQWMKAWVKWAKENRKQGSGHKKHSQFSYKMCIIYV